MTYRILVPIALEESQGPPLDFAQGEAAARGGSITLIHVVEFLPTAVSIDLPAGFPQVPVDAYRKGAEDALGEVAEQLADFRVDTVVEVGKPAAVVAEYAKKHGYDQIVVGSHARGVLARALLGSTAEALIRIAPCPVTVVRCENRE